MQTPVAKQMIEGISVKALIAPSISMVCDCYDSNRHFESFLMRLLSTKVPSKYPTMFMAIQQNSESVVCARFQSNFSCINRWKTAAVPVLLGSGRIAIEINCCSLKSRSFDDDFITWCRRRFYGTPLDSITFVTILVT